MVDSGRAEHALHELALAEWPPAAEARVISVSFVGPTAEVVLVVNGDYEYWMYFTRDDATWVLDHDGNGPS
ncbi:hypothetical protein [Klenkia soli]|uniref:hypothetical protein n=1 Tax=Klenkia soli TaxID=1052260 RepID=UPI000B827F28|nr:hypothetical protein [Klenkia soli]